MENVMLGRSNDQKFQIETNHVLERQHQTDPFFVSDLPILTGQKPRGAGIVGQG
jgi:hypothetical protein